jgi:hypothetical protein
MGGRLREWLCLAVGLGGLTGCFTPGVDAGHEGVLVEKPLVFGHGGVNPNPVPPGRTLVALTTDLVQIDVRPKQYDEDFGTLSAENTAVSFHAFLILQVLPGRSPELIRRFGPSWYRQNVKEAFRTFVREEVQRYPLFTLTTEPGTRGKLQDAIAMKVQQHIIDHLNLPVQLVRVVIGSIMPPPPVLTQTVETIVQEQRRLTMVEFQKAEEAREKSERQRGIADRAYREQVGLGGPEFVDLRRVEVQKEMLEHSPSRLHIIMGLERVGIREPPISHAIKPAGRSPLRKK